MVTYHGHKYLSTFKCLQGDCSDTCCSGLHVGITEENYVVLKKTLSNEPQFKERAEKFITISPSSVQEISNHPANYGAILQDEEKNECSFVSDDGACEIHRTFGEEVIGDICSLYPRTIAQVNDDVFIFASMACPEISRLVLTQNDAFDDVTIEKSAVPRHQIHRDFQFSDNSALYDQAFYHVNSLVDELLSNEEYPVDIRLVFVVTFGDVINASFRRDGLNDNVESLAQAMASFREKSTLDKIEAQYRALKIPGEYGLLLARNVLVARLRQKPAKNFVSIIHKVLFKRAPIDDELSTFFEKEPDFAYTPEELWSRYADYRSKLLKSFQPELNRYALHFIRHQWMTQWYNRSSSLPFFNAQTLTRLSLARALFYLHPGMPDFFSRVESDEDHASLVASLDDMAVESFHLVGKNVMHVPSFSHVVDAFIREQNLDELSRTVLLLPP